MTKEDAQLLDRGPNLPVPTPAKLRFSHHQLARLLAQGKSFSEASMLTGYDPAYISRLASSDPAFRDLVAHYSTEVEVIFADSVERMKAVGLTALEVVQERLTAEPENFSNRELLETVDTLMVKPMRAAAAGQSSSGPGVAPAVVVQFVTGKEAPSGPTFEGEFTRGTEGEQP